MGRSERHATDRTPTVLQAEALAESLFVHTVRIKCVRACMEEGNSARLLRNMDDFYNSLKGELAA